MLTRPLFPLSHTDDEAEEKAKQWKKLCWGIQPLASPSASQHRGSLIRFVQSACFLCSTLCVYIFLRRRSVVFPGTTRVDVNLNYERSDSGVCFLFWWARLSYSFSRLYVQCVDHVCASTFHPITYDRWIWARARRWVRLIVDTFKAAHVDELARDSQVHLLVFFFLSRSNFKMSRKSFVTLTSVDVACPWALRRNFAWQVHHLLLNFQWEIHPYPRPLRRRRGNLAFLRWCSPSCRSFSPSPPYSGSFQLRRMTLVSPVLSQLIFRSDYLQKSAKNKVWSELIKSQRECVYTSVMTNEENEVLFFSMNLRKMFTKCH